MSGFTPSIGVMWRAASASGAASSLLANGDDEIAGFPASTQISPPSPFYFAASSLPLKPKLTFAKPGPLRVSLLCLFLGVILLGRHQTALHEFHMGPGARAVLALR